MSGSLRYRVKDVSHCKCFRIFRKALFSHEVVFLIQGSWIQGSLGPLEVLHGSVLAPDTAEPQPITGGTRERDG